MTEHYGEGEEDCECCCYCTGEVTVPTYSTLLTTVPITFDYDKVTITSTNNQQEVNITVPGASCDYNTYSLTGGTVTTGYTVTSFTQTNSQVSTGISIPSASCDFNTYTITPGTSTVSYTVTSFTSTNNQQEVNITVPDASCVYDTYSLSSGAILASVDISASCVYPTYSLSQTCEPPPDGLNFWDIDTEYNEGDIVVKDDFLTTGNYYRLVVAANSGSEPGNDDGDAWELITLCAEDEYNVVGACPSLYSLTDTVTPVTVTIPENACHYPTFALSEGSGYCSGEFSTDVTIYTPSCDLVEISCEPSPAANTWEFWDIDTEYNQDDIVEHNGSYYRLIVAANSGSMPGNDDGDAWELMNICPPACEITVPTIVVSSASQICTTIVPTITVANQTKSCITTVPTISMSSSSICLSLSINPETISSNSCERNEMVWTGNSKSKFYLEVYIIDPEKFKDVPDPKPIGMGQVGFIDSEGGTYPKFDPEVDLAIRFKDQYGNTERHRANELEFWTWCPYLDREHEHNHTEHPDWWDESVYGPKLLNSHIQIRRIDDIEDIDHVDTPYLYTGHMGESPDDTPYESY